MERRELLRALALVPASAWAVAAGAVDYVSAEQVFDAVDRLEADVVRRLSALASALAGVRPLAESVAAAQRVHSKQRARLRRRLGLPVSSSQVPASDAAGGLEALRSSVEALVYAHAEGLPALGDAHVVQVFARHMVANARVLTVVQLWMEAEEQRG
jgi:hypothetical protein